MILSLRQIRRRIRSVENTKKMTRAMEMVAAAKLKKLQDMLRQSDRYIGELKRILGTLVREKPLAHPLLEKRPVGAIHESPLRTLVFLIASDTGLCGSYNTNVLEKANEFLKSGKYPIHFVTVGRYAAQHLKRRRQNISLELKVPRAQEIDEAIREITKIATNAFRTGEADRVTFIYTRVFSLGSLKPTIEQLFPVISQEELYEEPLRQLAPIDYLIEPSLDQVLEAMLPEFIEAQVSQWFKNSLVAEQVSRMLAMRQATDNASEMIDSLTLMRNKARQATITKELLEVVSGSRAQQMK